MPIVGAVDAVVAVALWHLPAPKEMANGNSQAAVAAAATATCCTKKPPVKLSLH